VSADPAAPGYPARDRYAAPEEAASYEARRFRSLRGRFVDRREQALIARALARVGAPLLRLLDLPAGTGRLAGLLGARAPLVLGADRSREMLRQGAKYDGIAVQADAASLPFPDRAFDAVVSLRLMGHLPPAERRAVLAEMQRVSRRFLVIAFYDSTPWTRLRRRLGSRQRRGPWYAEPIARTRCELGEMGFQVRMAWPLARFVSETWILLLERPDLREPSGVERQR
jgi:SAM-dependent methyltransferase